MDESPKKRVGPADGRLVEYHFGEHHDPFKVQATSLERAIRTFRVGALFPHRYADGRIPTEGVDEQGYTRTLYLASPPGSTIPIFARLEERKWVEVARIPPEGEDLDPRLLVMASQDLPGIDTTTALAPASAETGIRTAGRRDLEEKTLALTEAMAALEAQKRALATQVAAIKAELERRMEQIWVIELFLGSKEEVRQIRDGAPAPVDTPIAVRQQVLCMDEEIAIWDWLHHPERIGTFDFTHLEDFDRWVADDPTHLDAVCPWPKGVVGLRVRRKAKNRDDMKYGKDGSLDLHGVFQAVAADENDRMTYLLVRNGERVYRLWIDVNLWPRLFASEKDAREAADTEADGRWKANGAQARMKHQIAGLVALQGLIERSELLHPLPRAGINVFDPSAADCFLLVRDAEAHLALADGQDTLAHVVWKDVYRSEPNPQAAHDWREAKTISRLVQKGYERWLREQLAPGVRVMWLGAPPHRMYGSDSKPYSLERRTGNKRLDAWPERGEVYQLDDWHDYEGTFRYLPKDRIYPKSRDALGPDEDEDVLWEGRARARRVSFEAYSDELVPVDFLSWRVLEHLLHDRGQREHYGEFFRLAFDWWKIARDEAARERPFVDLVLHRAGVALDDEAERSRCERLLRWWKLKVKEHRTLGTDDAKALRMIEAAFRAGQDCDNDPEAALFRRPSTG